MFGTGYDLMEGMSVALVREVASLWASKLDVHVMAENAVEIVDGLRLQNEVARITVHVRPGLEFDGLRQAMDVRV